MIKQSATALIQRIALVVALVVAIVVCTGCVGNTVEDTGGSATEETSVATYADIENMDLTYTNRDKDASYDEAEATKICLEEETARVEGEGVSVDGSYVTIESEGTYLISGHLNDGQISVDVDKTAKVQLVLAGATIHNETGAAFYVKQADKCFITLAPDTENALSDGANYSFAEGEDEPNATLFSKEDLTINGTGSLAVTGSYADAIASKDDLVITGGTFTISAVDDGLRGKDSLKILDGSFQIETGQDCLKSSRDDDPTRGFVCINGGTFELNAGDDAIHGETYLLVTAGDIAITSCTEGLEAMVVQVDGGDIHVNAQDDALNAAAPSASETASADNKEMVKNAPDGDVSDMPQEMPDNESSRPGKFDNNTFNNDELNNNELNTDKFGERPNKFGEGGPDQGNRASIDAELSQNTENAGEQSNRMGGKQLAEVPDDGLAMSEGSERPQEDEGADRGQFRFGGMDAGNENCKIIINDGTIVLEAKGDAIDSNGSLEINGGTIYATGPTSNGDGALDYAIDAACNGGTILITGSAGMAQNFSSSTQPSAFVKVSGAANQKIVVSDKAGTELISYTPTAAFETVIVSSPDFKEGQEYSLITGNMTITFTAVTK